MDGSARLVERRLADGSLPNCSVRTIIEQLFRRPVSDKERSEVLPPYADYFDGTQHIFRALMRALVEDPAYRTIQ